MSCTRTRPMGQSGVRAWACLGARALGVCPGGAADGDDDEECRIPLSRVSVPHALFGSVAVLSCALNCNLARCAIRAGNSGRAAACATAALEGARVRGCAAVSRWLSNRRFPAAIGGDVSALVLRARARLALRTPKPARDDLRRALRMAPKVRARTCAHTRARRSSPPVFSRTWTPESYWPLRTRLARRKPGKTLRLTERQELQATARRVGRPCT